MKVFLLFKTPANVSPSLVSVFGTIEGAREAGKVEQEKSFQGFKPTKLHIEEKEVINE